MKKRAMTTTMNEKTRKIICNLCSSIMTDLKPGSLHGVFYHPRHFPCENAGKFFGIQDPRVTIFGVGSCKGPT